MSPFNSGDCFIEVTACTGSTVFANYVRMN